MEAKAEHKVSMAIQESEWLCKCGNLLGYVVKAHIHELHVKVLGLHREHWPVMEGDGRVWCPVCGTWKEWWWGREAMEKLIARRRKPPV